MKLFSLFLALILINPAAFAQTPGDYAEYFSAAASAASNFDPSMLRAEQSTLINYDEFETTRKVTLGTQNLSGSNYFQTEGYLFSPVSKRYGALEGVEVFQSGFDTVSGLAPVLPTKAAEAAFVWLSMAMPSNAQEHMYEEGSTDKLSESGRTYMGNFCTTIGGSSFSENGSLNDFMYLPSNAEDINKASRVHLAGSGTFIDKTLLLKLTTTSKDVIKKFCGIKIDSNCRERMKTDPSFQKVCEESFLTYFVPPHFDLEKNYSAALANATPDSKSSKDNFGGINGSCNGGRNCFFMPKSKQNKEGDSCNPFNCSMADKESLDSTTFEWTRAFLLASPGFDFSSSDEEQCEDCFLEQLKLVTGKSHGKAKKILKEEKEKSKKRLADMLAANRASKSLLDFSASLETAFDMSKLYPQTFSDINLSNLCGGSLEKEISKLKNSACGGTLDQGEVESRIKLAFESLGLESAGENIESALLEKIDPKEREGNLCRREDFVKSAKIQWSTLNNKKYSDAFGEVIADLARTNLASEMCDNPETRGSLGNIVDVYANTRADQYWEKVKGKVASSLLTGSADELVAAACEGGGPLERLACGKDSELLAMLNEKHLFTLKTEMHNQTPRPERVKEVLVSGFRARLKSALEVPMQMDPTIRMALNDWNTFCGLKSESQFKNMSEGMIGFVGGRTKTLWDVANYRSNRLGIAETINSYPDHKSLFKARINGFISRACETTQKSLSDAICFEGETFPSERDKNGSPYSAADIKKAKRQLAEIEERSKKEADLPQGLGFNSMACELSSIESKNPRYFNKEDLTLASAGGGASGFEEALALNERKNGIGDGVAAVGGLNFHSWNGCSEELGAFNDRALSGQGSGVEVTMSKKYNAEELLKTANITKTQVKQTQANNSGIVAYGGGGAEDFSGTGGGFNRGGIPFNPGTSETLKTISAVTGESSYTKNEGTRSEVQTTNAPVRTVDEDEASDNPKEQSTFKNMFGYLNEPTESATPTMETNVTGYRSPASLPVTTESVCGEECLEGLINGKELASSEKLAETAGIKDIANSNEDLKKAFEDVLDGKLEDNNLAKLKEENDKLRLEMQKIREDIAAGSKPVRVLDSNGTDRTHSFPAPASSNNVVFNPRNHSENEFRSRAYFDARSAQYSPSFEPLSNSTGKNSGGERLSLGDYSSQRRSAISNSKTGDTKPFNGDIDKSFLQVNSASQVDDIFVEKYVEHVDQNAGSIEHLVVFENGRPAKIRVPDPQNPGAYVEHPIVGEMVEKILEKVEEDEVESYAVYNMVNFGQSLSEFVNSLEAESSNIATLGVLNRKLNELRNLE